MWFNCLKATEQLRGGSLLFTTTFQKFQVFKKLTSSFENAKKAPKKTLTSSFVLIFILLVFFKFRSKFLIKFKWISSLLFSLENIRTDFPEFPTTFMDDPSGMLCMINVHGDFPFLYPWKHQTTKDFLTFSGGI